MDRTRLQLCLHQLFTIPVFLISEIQTLELMDRGRRDSPRISQLHVLSFCFIFKNSSIGGKQLQSLRAVMQIWSCLMPGPGVAMVSAAWLTDSSRDLWLPWLGVVKALPA